LVEMIRNNADKRMKKKELGLNRVFMVLIVESGFVVQI
jgi:hypothetical protein